MEIIEYVFKVLSDFSDSFLDVVFLPLVIITYFVFKLKNGASNSNIYRKPKHIRKK